MLPPVGEAFTEFATLHAEPHFESSFGVEVCHVFECLVEPQAELTTAPVIALAGASGTDLLAGYGRLWKRLLGCRGSATTCRRSRHIGQVTPRPPMTGWNSWDYYAGAVTRAAMDENTVAAKKLFGCRGSATTCRRSRHNGKALKVIAIDEGWECQWGAWEGNAKFPEGLADFCRHVRLAGNVPGVWTAPLLVNTYNPLFLEHPDWFAARADGQLQTKLYSYGPMA